MRCASIPSRYDTYSIQYIFQGELPGSIDEEKPKVFKKSKLNFTHKMLNQTPEVTSGGKVRITDSRNFPISKTVHEFVNFEIIQSLTILRLPRAISTLSQARRGRCTGMGMPTSGHSSSKGEHA
jgi:hypothetical protein